MALNIQALKKADGELNSRKSGGSTLYLSGKDISDETFIRLLPPLPELNGIYFLEQIGYWINKQYYVSPATFGLPCPIEERLKEMNRQKDSDADLKKLIEGVTKKSTFLIPVLHLEPKYNSDNELDSVSIIEDKPKVLQAGSMLMKAINKVALAPKLVRKLANVDDGITDRIKGYNIILSKSGKGLDTEYGAYEDEQIEMDAKYYENIPSILNLTKAKVYTDEYLNAVLDNYFDGDPKPDDSLKVSRYKKEEDSIKDKKSKVEDTPKRVTNKVETVDEVEDDIDDLPKRTTVKSVKQTTPQIQESKPKSKSILDELEDLD